MNKFRFVFVFFGILFSPMPFGRMNQAIAITNSNGILAAIDSRICWQTFWGGYQWYKLGSTDVIMVHQVGDITYVWSNSLSLVPHVSEWADFFVLYNKDNRYIVNKSYGSNLDSKSARMVFEKKLTMIDAANATAIKMKIPFDCKPQFDFNTLQKSLMLNEVSDSVFQQLKAFNKYKSSQYSNHLKIVVANFNIDYPETFVLVPSKREILVVSFSTESNPFNERKVEYMVNELSPNYGETADDLYNEMRKKILKYGISLEINLGAESN